MLKVLLVLGFFLTGNIALAAGVPSSVPSGCRECLSQCPHDTRDLKECDRGCPNSCSKAQVNQYKQELSQSAEGQDCYECMSGCPHATKDLRECDQGCPNSCDMEGLKKAFFKANEQAKSCGTGAKTNSRALRIQ